MPYSTESERRTAEKGGVMLRLRQLWYRVRHKRRVDRYWTRVYGYASVADYQASVERWREVPYRALFH